MYVVKKKYLCIALISASQSGSFLNTPTKTLLLRSAVIKNTKDMLCATPLVFFILKDRFKIQILL